jgi:hypothetical protein
MGFMGSGIGAALGNSAQGYHQGRTQRQSRENAQFQAERAEVLATQADEMYRYAEKRRRELEELRGITHPQAINEAETTAKISGMQQPGRVASAEYGLEEDEWKRGLGRDTRQHRGNVVTAGAEEASINAGLGVDKAKEGAGRWRSPGQVEKRDDEQATGEINAKTSKVAAGIKRDVTDEAAEDYTKGKEHRAKVKLYKKTEELLKMRYGEAYQGWAEKAEQASKAAYALKTTGNPQAIVEMYGEIQDGFEAEYITNEDGTVTLQFRDEETGELTNEGPPSKTYSSIEEAADHFEQVVTDPTYYETQGGAQQQGKQGQGTLKDDKNYQKAVMMAKLASTLPENAKVDMKRLLLEAMRSMEKIDTSSNNRRDTIADMALQMMTPDKDTTTRAIEPDDLFPEEDYPNMTPEERYAKAYQIAMTIAQDMYDLTVGHAYGPAGPRMEGGAGDALGISAPGPQFNPEVAWKDAAGIQ